MKNKIEVSAPGKLMLFGEHAVIYGRPCIVTAVDQRIRVKAETQKNKRVMINAPDVGVKGYVQDMNGSNGKETPKGLKFVLAAIKNFGELREIPNGLRIETESDFSAKFGFGSSSAVTVGVVKALAGLFEMEISNEELFKVSYKSVLDVQGVGSGFDLAAAIWGGILYFVTGGKKIVPLKLKNLPLVVGYTGIKADTTTLVKAVSEKHTEFPDLVDSIFDVMGKIVGQARRELINGQWEKVGKLMDFNQGVLEALGVGTTELSNLMYASRQAGALGAKLSGAGGGDCMIALVEKNKAEIERAIKEKGGTVIHVKTGADGVRIESHS